MDWQILVFYPEPEARDMAMKLTFYTSILNHSGGQIGKKIS
jgi:hypothetical protein